MSVTVKASATTVDGTDTATLTATVQNDKNSGGVTWKVSGGGALSSQTKTSATYTAPAAASSAVTATVTATSVADSSKSGTATITVPALLTFTTAATDLVGQVGTAYSVQLKGSGGIPPYTNWTLGQNSGVLPPCLGLTLAGVLSSATPPSANCAGTFTQVIFRFTDSGTPTPLVMSTAPMTITIAAAPIIVFPSASGTVPGPATFGEAYSGSIAATGGAGALTYTLTGSLPPGLSLGAGTGMITGKPTAVGTYGFSVTGADAFNDLGFSPTYSILVSYAPVTIAPASGSLPGGTAGTAYSQTLTASGGSGTGYTWTVTGLPADGLDYTASGDTVTISGTPTDAQTVSFSASVTDSAANSGGPNNYSIVVSNASSGDDSKVDGTYACILEGFNDNSGARTATVTSFQADGKGNFTGGVYDSNRRGKTPDSGTLTGTYSIGADGNGTASIISTSTVASTQDTRAFALAVAPSATPAGQFSLAESDDAGGTPSGKHGIGTCYLTTPSAFAASTLNGNSFVWLGNGEDQNGAVHVNVGRVLFASSGLTVTSGASDGALAGNSTLESNTITGGSFTAPDSTTGRGTLALTFAGSGGANFALYTIDTNHALVLETDSIGPADLFVGEVNKQQQSTYSGANLSGGLVFYTQALEFNTSGSTSPTGYYSIIYAGSGDGKGNLTIAQSYMSENGTYTAGGTAGTVAVTFSSTTPGRATIAVNSGTIVLYFFDTNNAFEMSLGGGQNPVESGRMEPQTQKTFTDAALAGTYMMTEMAPLEANALDQIGELTVGSDGSLKGQFTTGGEGQSSFDQSFSATYAWDSTATGTGTFLAASPANWSCAVLTSTRFVCVDQTAQPPAMRIFQQ